MATGRGGRKEKNEEQQLTQVVKTTLTRADLDMLQRVYNQRRVGQKISFAEFIRQQLLAKSSYEKENDERLSLLSLQLELAEVNRLLDQILNAARASERNKPAEKTAGKESRSEIVQGELEQKMGLYTDRIDALIRQISQWLYDCLPEKI